jgi:hypothetical protein
MCAAHPNLILVARAAGGRMKKIPPDLHAYKFRAHTRASERTPAGMHQTTTNKQAAQTSAPFLSSAES